jgi:hypothetical protein
LNNNRYVLYGCYAYHRDIVDLTGGEKHESIRNRWVARRLAQPPPQPPNSGHPRKKPNNPKKPSGTREFWRQHVPTTATFQSIRRHESTTTTKLTTQRRNPPARKSTTRNSVTTASQPEFRNDDDGTRALGSGESAVNAARRPTGTERCND